MLALQITILVLVLAQTLVLVTVVRNVKSTARDLRRRFERAQRAFNA